MASYRLAGQVLTFALPVPELQLFAVPDQGPAAYLQPPVLSVPSIPSVQWKQPCQASGWVGGAERHIEVHAGMAGLQMTVEAAGVYQVEPLLGRVDAPPAGAADLLSGLDREVLLGPVLVMALALRGTWCLHASAVLFDGKVFVFLGESGQGKSTLGAYLAHCPGWSLVADDILPVTLEGAALAAWPHFPQLKLPDPAQPGRDLPERLPVHALFALNPVPVDASPSLNRLAPRQAAEVLLRHTAGTRLFAAELLSRHLVFCSEAAQGEPVYALGYPHSKEALPQVRSLLESL